MLERRASTREPLVLPVRLADGRAATTRDLSSGGIYLVLHDAGPMDPWLSFEFAVPQVNLKFSAAAQVVRTEPLASGRTGFGMRLHGSRLVALD